VGAGLRIFPSVIRRGRDQCSRSIVDNGPLENYGWMHRTQHRLGLVSLLQPCYVPSASEATQLVGSRNDGLLKHVGSRATPCRVHCPKLLHSKPTPAYVLRQLYAVWCDHPARETGTNRFRANEVPELRKNFLNPSTARRRRVLFSKLPSAVPSTGIAQFHCFRAC